MALEFTDANFQEEVLNASQPVLVDFWAEWCGPCKAIGPTIEELASEYADKAKVGKVDIDSNRDIAMQFNIQSIPSILIFKDGQVIETFVGMKAKGDLAAAIDAVM
ncbi:MAG: thioredoxin [Phycisphaerales bacterium]|nr:thioredoxin [Phycisphaerales bacterium]